MRPRGISLIVVVLLVVIIATSVLGIISFVFQGARLSALRSASESAFYRAQAGVNKAIWGYSSPQSPTKGSLTPATSSLFTYGKTSNYLFVEAADCDLGGNKLSGITLYNVSDAEDIIIYSMIVNWPVTETGPKTLTGFKVGTAVKSGVSRNPGELIPLDPPQLLRQLKANVIDCEWTFFSYVQPDNAPIYVTFILDKNADLDQAQKRKACVLGKIDIDDSGYYTGNSEFTITSTGKIGFGSTTLKRTVEATYDTNGAITSWQETSSHL